MEVEVVGAKTTWRGFLGRILMGAGLLNHLAFEVRDMVMMRRGGFTGRCRNNIPCTLDFVIELALSHSPTHTHYGHRVCTCPPTRPAPG